MTGCVDITTARQLYESGLTLRQVAHRLGVSRNTIQRRLASAGVKRRRTGPISAVGRSVKPSGYVEFTRGMNKGRSEHRVVMEARLGRPLRCDEVVHHVNGVRHDNRLANLALMSRSEHARLHRLFDAVVKRQQQGAA